MNCCPSKRQLDYLDWELGVFFHFGIRTFFEGFDDWDKRDMPLSHFNPYNLDCRQWIKSIKVAGAKYAILTCKHHDGFANWPSAFTEYSVKNTPWRKGEGDVVKEFTDACREFGLAVGLYYSPAQIGYSFANPKDYDDYFINQISELLNNYGEIDYLWFDGCGSEGHEYDKDRIIKVIREAQPNILIFSMWDPDTRWVGNEEGIVPLGSQYQVESARTSINLQESEWLDKPRFLPYECDFKIRRKRWFYSEYDSHLLRSLDDLMGLYYYSVGRGGNMLINIAPDRRGLLPELDSQRFIEFGNEVKKRFSNPIPCKLTRENNAFTLSLEKEQHINHAIIMENLEKGQSIKGFKINYHYNVDMCVYEGRTIGHKQICCFPNVYGDKFIIEITDFEGEYDIDSIQLFCI